MTQLPAKFEHSPWPHRWAVMLACATFPLVWWGGLVTVSGSGMAFRDWLTSDGVFMPLYPWLSSAGDKFIEHGHRLLGMLSGLLTIALVASLWISESRRWVRWFGVALFAGVILQGVLGGMRVKFDEQSPETARIIALIHGCTGPFFFAACAAMATVTSRRWQSDCPAILAENESTNVEIASAGHRPRMGRLLGAKLFRLAVLTAALAYVQLAIGAVVRHSPLLLSDSAATIFQVAVYFHVLLAIAVAAHVLMLAHKCFWGGVAPRAAVGLALLILVQLLLGASTWIVKYGLPAWATSLIGETGHFNRASDFASSAVITAHGAVGALIVALAVVIALRVGREFGFQSSAHRAAPHLAGVLA